MEPELGCPWHLRWNSRSLLMKRGWWLDDERMWSPAPSPLTTALGRGERNLWEHPATSHTRDTGLGSSHCWCWFQASLPHCIPGWHFESVTYGCWSGWREDAKKWWPCLDRKVEAKSLCPYLDRKPKVLDKVLPALGLFNFCMSFTLCIPSLAAVLPADWNQDLAHFSCLCRSVFSHSI